MSDIFLFLLASVFLLLTLPIWAILGIGWAILIAGWGIIKFLLTIIAFIIGLGVSIFTSDGLPIEKLLFKLLGAVISLIQSLWDALISSFDPVSYFWEFSRYEHNWWAFFISIVLSIFWLGALDQSPRRK